MLAGSRLRELIVDRTNRRNAMGVRVVVLPEIECPRCEAVLVDSQPTIRCPHCGFSGTRGT